MYPTPGFCRISLTVTISTCWTSTLEPLGALIDIKDPERVRLNAVVFPSKLEAILSSVWRTPTLQPVNSSENTFWTSNSNCLKSLIDPVVGIPVRPPVGIVKVCPGWYPTPLLLIEKSITLDPLPTTISTVPFKPSCVEPTYSKGMLLYESGSWISTNGLINVVYPDPGFVMVTEVEICPVPVMMVAKPTWVMVAIPTALSPTLTFTNPTGGLVTTILVWDPVEISVLMVLPVLILTNVDAVETMVVGKITSPIPIVQLEPLLRVPIRSRILPVFSK